MKNFFKKRWVIASIAALLAVAVLVTTLVLVLGGDKTPGSTDDAPAQGQVNPTNEVLGTSDKNESKDALRQLMADLYYQAGVAKWGNQYAIVLGGGHLSVSGNGYLAAGQVTYGDVKALFPYDNSLVLCSIQGLDLSARFFNSDNSNCFISYGDYGTSIKDQLKTGTTYYVVTDTYTAENPDNKLTVVAQYADDVYPRDLLADYIRAGGLGQPAPSTQPNVDGTTVPNGSTTGGNSGTGGTGGSGSGGNNTGDGGDEG